MKVYSIPTGIEIEPFQDPMDKTFILDEGLGAYTNRILKETGLELGQGPPKDIEIGSERCLVLFDNVYLTKRTIQDFVRAVSKTDGPKAVLALPKGPLTEYAAPLQHRIVEKDESGREIVLFDVFAVKDVGIDSSKGPAAVREELLDKAERVVIQPEVSVLDRPSPKLFGEPLATNPPISLWGAANLRHWVHILWINRQALETRLLEMQEACASEGKLFMFGDKEYERISRRKKPPVFAGENFNVHPSAVVEHAILGDNVNIDIRGLVRRAFVGDNVGLTAFHMALGTVVGNGCHTLADTCLYETVCMPHSTLSNAKLQYTLVGSEAFVTTGVLFYEVGLDGPVMVMDQGRWVSSERRLLGGCVGHRCVLGTRALFMGGRAVPNGYMVVLRPGDGILKIPKGVEPGELLYNDDGSLRPLREIEPPWQPPEW